jgi:KUP system potassium uptake protein
VLSAVEGLKVVSPDLHSLVVPITVAIIAVLFAIQRLGTGAAGASSARSWPCGSSSWRSPA